MSKSPKSLIASKNGLDRMPSQNGKITEKVKLRFASSIPNPTGASAFQFRIYLGKFRLFSLIQVPANSEDLCVN
jgi:hypothetical protein